MSKEPEKLNLESVNITEEKLNQLKHMFPEVFTEGDQIDFDKLKTTLGNQVDENEERFGLQWPGKKDCFKIIQEPAKGTLQPAPEESEDWDNTENLFIEGDNLEVMKLLQKSYYGKVKMIYIDPPYNTGNEFIYPDNYKENLNTYLAYTGQLDEEGYKFSTNTETEGRYHSNWLNMLYPRLFMARNLLKDDGVIFISIDDNEVADLKLMCNEIFGEENFLSQLIWLNKEGGGGSDSKYFRIKHEYILCYCKNISATKIYGVEISNYERYSKKDSHYNTRGPYYLQKLNQASIRYSESLNFPIISPDGTEIWPTQENKKACWRWSEEKVNWGIENDFIEFRKDQNGNWQVFSKQYLNLDNQGNSIDRTNPPSGIIDQFSSTQASKHLEKILGPFIYPYSKPVNLIKYLTKITSNNSNDIVLDFFSGSSSTAEAITSLNSEDYIDRKYIMVQLPEKTSQDSEAYKIGYKNIAQIGKERIRIVTKNIKANQKNNENDIFKSLETKSFELDLGFRVFKLDQSNFKEWEGRTEEKPVEEQLKLNIDHIRANSSEEQLLYEILLKSGFPLTVKIDTIELAGKKVYSLADGAMLICLEDSLNEELILKIAEEKPSKVVVLDKGFNGQDELKTNAVQIMKSHGVDDFKTV